MSGAEQAPAAPQLAEHRHHTGSVQHCAALPVLKLAVKKAILKRAQLTVACRLWLDTGKLCSRGVLQVLLYPEQKQGTFWPLPR